MFEFDSLKKWLGKQEENLQNGTEQEEKRKRESLKTIRTVKHENESGRENGLVSGLNHHEMGHVRETAENADLSSGGGSIGKILAFDGVSGSSTAENGNFMGGPSVVIPAGFQTSPVNVNTCNSSDVKWKSNYPNLNLLQIREKMDTSTPTVNSTENINADRISMDDSAFDSDNEVNSTIDFISELPFELAVKIMSYLSPTHSTLLVSKAWNSVTNDNAVWKEAYQRKFGLLPCFKVDPSHTINSSVLSASEKYALQRELHANNIAKMRDWKIIYRKKHRLLQNWKEGLVDAQFFDGHSDAVYCLQFDSKKIISGSRDRSIKVWDLATSTCTSTFYGHQGSVLCLQYNDKHIISGSSDSTIRVWDLHTGHCIRVLSGHLQPVLDIQFYGPDYIVSCSKDWSIKVWSLHTGELIRTLEGHTAAVNSIHVYKDTLASASGDSTIRLWDLTTGALIRILKGHERGLACVQFQQDLIASGSNDKSIKIWNANTGQCTHTLSNHRGLVRTLAFDEHHLVSGSYDQSIKVWNPTTGHLMLDMGQAHRSWVFHVQIDAARIISSSQDFKIIVWDFSNGEKYEEFLV